MKKFFKSLKDKLSKKSKDKENEISEEGIEAEISLEEEEQWELSEEVSIEDADAFDLDESVDDTAQIELSEMQLDSDVSDEEESLEIETPDDLPPIEEEFVDEEVELSSEIEVDEESLELSAQDLDDELPPEIDDEFAEEEETFEQVMEMPRGPSEEGPPTADFDEDDDDDFEGAEIKEFPRPTATDDATGEVQIDTTMMQDESEEGTAEHSVEMEMLDDEMDGANLDETGKFSRMQVDLPEAEGNLPRSPITDKTKSFFNTFKEKISTAFGAMAAKRKANASGDNPFDWDELVNNIFSPRIRPQIHQAFLALFVLSTTFTLGKIVALAVNSLVKKPVVQSKSLPATRKRKSSTSLSSIAQKNLFNAKQSDDEQDEKKPVGTKKPRGPMKKCIAATRSSSLPIKLVSTIVLQDSVKSLASVSVRGQKKNLEYREGDKVENLAVIGTIDRQRVFLRNKKTGECEFIENQDKASKKLKPLKILSENEGKKLLSERPKEISNEGNNYKIKKTFRDKMLQDISTVLTQAKANRIDNPDGTISFKMTNIVPGSIYSHLDIQEGDIITKINGKEITSLNEIMTMFGKIRDIDNLSISVRRNGVDKDMDYNFE